MFCGEPWLYRVLSGRLIMVYYLMFVLIGVRRSLSLQLSHSPAAHLFIHPHSALTFSAKRCHSRWSELYYTLVGCHYFLIQTHAKTTLKKIFSILHEENPLSSIML